MIGARMSVLVVLLCQEKAKAPVSRLINVDRDGMVDLHESRLPYPALPCLHVITSIIPGHPTFSSRAIYVTKKRLMNGRTNLKHCSAAVTGTVTFSDYLSLSLPLLSIICSIVMGRKMRQTSYLARNIRNSSQRPPQPTSEKCTSFKNSVSSACLHTSATGPLIVQLITLTRRVSQENRISIPPLSPYRLKPRKSEDHTNT